MGKLLALTLILCSGMVHAKDLPSRLGIGYSNQFGLNRDLPSIAMRYYPNSDYGLMGALGVDTERNNSRFGFMAKIIKIVFREDNLNFYTGAAAGLISQETPTYDSTGAEVSGRNNSGFELAGLVGAEFFLPGLENLGLSFEAGVGVTSISNQVRFRTIGDSPLRAGMTFYF